MTQKIVLYRDGKNEYRWRFVAANGRTLADSGEGYKERADAVRGALVVTGLDIDRYREAALDALETHSVSDPAGRSVLLGAVAAADEGWYDEQTRTVGFTWLSFVTEREHNVVLVEQ